MPRVLFLMFLHAARVPVCSMAANNAQRRGGSLTKWRHMFGWKRMHEGFGEHGGLHGFHVKILLHAAHHTIAEFDDLLGTVAM
jgi:hypothetical protein